ncbi:MAG: S-layer homology domain-containing protein [Thermaerobacter sp.]|nr:S-layer homology domain-containing protein [Thermaerobacter sp.]
MYKILFPRLFRRGLLPWLLALALAGGAAAPVWAASVNTFTDANLWATGVYGNDTVNPSPAPPSQQGWAPFSEAQNGLDMNKNPLKGIAVPLNSTTESGMSTFGEQPYESSTNPPSYWWAGKDIFLAIRWDLMTGFPATNAAAEQAFGVAANPADMPDIQVWGDALDKVAGSDQFYTFDPGADITEGEFAAILTRAVGLSVNTSVWDNGQPYAQALESAGIVKGAPDLTADISRGQAATWIGRALAYEKVALAANPPSFSDVPGTSLYYAGVSQAAGYGIIVGFPDGTFRPADPITRAQAAVMVVKAVEALKTSPPSLQTLQNVVQGYLNGESAIEYLANRADQAQVAQNPSLITKAMPTFLPIMEAYTTRSELYPLATGWDGGVMGPDGVGSGYMAFVGLQVRPIAIYNTTAEVDVRATSVVMNRNGQPSSNNSATNDTAESHFFLRLLNGQWKVSDVLGSAGWGPMIQDANSSYQAVPLSQAEQEAKTLNIPALAQKLAAQAGIN